MFNIENRSTPESTTDTLKWIGKLVLTVAAGIILGRYGVRIPDNVKLCTRRNKMIIPPLYPSPTIERISLGVIVAVGIVGLALSARKPWIIM